MADQACPGRENDRYREAWRAYGQALDDYDPLDPGQSRPEPPGVQAVPGAPVWCGTCAAKIRQRLGELDDLACILQACADGHRDAPDGQRVTGTLEDMSPSKAADDVDEIARMLGSWEHAYRDLRGWPCPRRDGELAAWVTSCSSWLMAHLTGILASALAEDFGKEILQWNREFTGKAKAGVRKLTKPMRCPRCQLLMLTQVDGEDRVTCRNPECLRVLSLAEYEAEVERLAGMPQ